MAGISNHVNLLQKRGRPLLEFIPGSVEVALSVEDTLKALELLEHEKIAILGGDILTEIDGRLTYAYQIWGDEYQYLNWYCNRDNNETDTEYLVRSHLSANEGIIKARNTANSLNSVCYIVLVI